MKLSRVIYFLLFFALIIQTQVIIAYAQTEQPPTPRLAFLDLPDKEITIYEDKFPFTLNVVNQSTENITVRVSLLGLEDVLETDQPTVDIDPGEILIARFSLREKDLTQKRSGLIVFSSQRGDVIYKTVTLDPEPKTTEVETAKKDQVLLINVVENINWNELQIEQLELFFLNDGEDVAKFNVQLYLLGKETDFDTVDCGKLEINPFSTYTAQCDLRKLSPLLERGSYAGFIILQDTSNKWANHLDFTLHVPSSETQPISGPKLEFLGGDEPIVIDYNRLLNDSTLQIGLINKGQENAIIESVEVIFPKIVDQSGKSVYVSLLVEQNNAFTIPALETVWLNLNLQSLSENQPRDGNYNGFLIIRTQNDQTIIVKAVSLQASATVFCKIK